MPEIPVDEDDDALFSENNVWFAGQARNVTTVTESRRRKSPHNQLFESGSLRPVRLHAAPALCRSKTVGHRDSRGSRAQSS